MIHLLLRYNINGENMAKENEILEFEDLLKEVHQQKKNTEPKPNRSVSYFTALFIYVLMMFVFGSVIFTIFMGIDSMKVTYSEEDLLIRAVSQDSSGMGILDNNHVELLLPSYEGDIIRVGDYEGYTIFVSSTNTHYEALLMLEVDGIKTINEVNVLSILQDETLTSWTENGPMIHLYAGNDQVLPDFFLADYERVDGPLTTLSDFSLAFANFLIYLAMLPPILFLLKKDLSDDFSAFKKRKKEWFIIIAVGYLYLILGNILSNFISNFLSDLLGVPISESLNQLTIIAALQSEGTILMMISAIVFGPIIEELIFRKAIFGIFSKNTTGLIVSSVIFGTIHLVSEPSVASALVNGSAYFIMGVVFGLIYIKNDKNIYAPMIVHILSNLIAVLGILFIL